MNKKGFFAGLAIGIMLLGACQDQVCTSSMS